VELTAISNLNCPSHPILDTVDVHALPNATFTYKQKSTNTLCIEDSVLFMANDTAYNNSYLWQPAHGFNNDNKPVIWGKVEEAQSDITLTVTDPFGCVGTSTQELDPSVCCAVMFPNAFSPNGDGINDKWEIKYLNDYPECTVEIFTRTGQMIFQSYGYATPWDGTYHGSALPIGTYYYIIQPGRGRATMSGSVTILR
jgi:gliding motility-associated-like protein